MTPEELKERTKAFALRILRLSQSLPNSKQAQTIGTQILRSGTSVGANYRAVCHARSEADFIAKLGVMIEEADETAYWIELLIDGGYVKKGEARRLAKRSERIDRDTQCCS